MAAERLRGVGTLRAHIAGAGSEAFAPGRPGRLLLLWAPFLAVYIWSARYNPLTHVPAYGDLLEVIWGADWLAENLREWGNPFYYGRIFHPTGWPPALLPHTLTFLASMGFVRLFLSEAATYNLFLFASFAVAYAGLIRAARLYTSRLGILILAGLLYAFWGMRWVRLGGHLHVLWLSALLPWLFWALRRPEGRRRVVFCGVAWALCIIASFYGVWLGALLVGLDFLDRPSRARLRDMALIALLTAVLSLPTLLPFWQAQQMVSAPFLSLEHVAGWGASLNSLPIPAVYHPWLSGLAGAIYHGPPDESAVANLGLLAVVLTVTFLLFRRPAWATLRLPLLLTGAGLLLALGPVLRWDGQVVQAAGFTAVNETLWGLGQTLKPDVFPGALPQDLAGAVPLPAWPLYATLPFLEGNRVVARFALVGGLGLVLLLVIILNRVRSTWLLALLAALLLLERTPWPLQGGVPLPAAAHPVEARLPDGATALIDLLPSGEGLTLAISGELLYASARRAQPTAGGVGTMWPEPAWFLVNWLARHPRPLQHEDFPIILQGFGVDTILLAMQTAAARDHLAGELAAGLRLEECIAPPPDPSPWPYDVCLLHVAAADQRFTAGPEAGWSAPEPWGRWAVGTEAVARWVVPQGGTDYEMLLEAFPNSVEGRVQEVTVRLNGTEVGRIRFEEDGSLATRLALPGDLLKTGWNELVFLSAYALSPAELTGGANPDPRPLSFAVNRLSLQPAAAPAQP